MLCEKIGIAELLEFLHDFVVQARIVVIRAAEHHDADAVFALELVENFAGALANAAFIILEALKPASMARSFSSCERPRRASTPVHLEGEQLPVREIENRIDILHVDFGENVVFFRERGLHGFRSGGDGGAGVGAGELDQRGMQHVVHREENGVERLLAVLHLNQVVDVRDADLRREAGIDGAAIGAGAI